MTDGGGHRREGRLIGGRYRLVERIGSGGMGAVWRAHDELVDREVAVKQPHLPGDPADTVHQRAAHRLHREARAAARVEHPSAVTIHDVVVEDGLPFIVMELIRGESLHERLRRGTLTPAESARAGLAVLGALRAAHSVGIVHRDVKPANVLLGPHGRVVLTDFGIAHVQGEESLTVSGEFIGSLEFVAPERMSGRGAGPASDLWSLGVLLYSAVEGGSPFRRTTVESTLAAILAADPPEPRRAGPLGPLIVRLLTKNPDDRPGPAETAALLEAVAEGWPIPERGEEAGRTQEPSGLREFGDDTGTVLLGGGAGTGGGDEGTHGEGPQSEGPGAERPTAEEPETEQATAEQPGAEQATAENPTAEQALTEEPAGEHPADEPGPDARTPDADVSDADVSDTAAPDVDAPAPDTPTPDADTPDTSPPPARRRTRTRTPIRTPTRLRPRVIVLAAVAALLAGGMWVGAAFMDEEGGGGTAVAEGATGSSRSSGGTDTRSTPPPDDTETYPESTPAAESWVTHREDGMDAVLALPVDYLEFARQGGPDDQPRLVVFEHGSVQVRLTQWDAAPRDPMGQALEAASTWAGYDPDARTQYEETSFQGDSAVLADTTYSSDGQVTRVMQLMILTDDSRLYELRVDMPGDTPEEEQGTAVFVGARERLELGEG
ncbi:protein kinase [Streptomyces sp. NPDC088789]|uniref:protein kinase domain-containing protein n=1 Tax=Streptomyces sp. NPDC088789 TaxID=3365899 RepID=UPI0038097989